MPIYGGVNFPKLSDAGWKAPWDFVPRKTPTPTPTPAPRRTPSPSSGGGGGYTAPWDFVPRSTPSPAPSYGGGGGGGYSGGGGYYEPPGAYQEVRYVAPTPPPPPPAFTPIYSGGGYGEPAGAWAEERGVIRPAAAPLQLTRIEQPPAFPAIRATGIGGTEPTLTIPTTTEAPRVASLRAPTFGSREWRELEAPTPPPTYKGVPLSGTQTSIERAAWNAVAPVAGAGLQKAAELAGPVIDPILRAVNTPYEKLTEPLIARDWNKVNTPDYLERQQEQMAKIGLKAQFGQIDWNTLGSLLGEYGKRNWQELWVDDIQKRTILQAATPEQLERYRQEAPPGVQFINGALFDPLNALDAPLGYLARTAKIARVNYLWAPTAKTVEQITADLAKQGTRANSALVRFATPWRLTNPAQAADLVNKSVDVVNWATTNAPQGQGLQWLETLIRNPDDLAAQTAGVSSSPIVKQTAALLRRTLGETADGGTDFKALTEILNTAKKEQNDIYAVAELGKRLQDAAESFFPTPSKNIFTRMRDGVNNVLSIAYMGYSPGYAFRNAANNLFTALIDGTMPFESNDAIRNFWTRWGPMPIAGKSGIGTAGGVWQSREKLIDHLAGLTEPTGLKGMFAGVNFDSPTLVFAQNTERAFSERLTYSASRKYWRQIWGNTLRDVEGSLRTLSLPPETHEYIVRKLYGAVHPSEVNRIIAEAVQGSDLARTLPTTVADDVAQAAGEATADAVRQVVETTGSPAAAEPMIQHAEQTAQVIAELRALAPKQPTKDGFLGLLDQIDNLLTESRNAHDEAVEAMWQEVRGMGYAEAKPLWETFWSQMMGDMQRVFHEADVLEAGTLHDLGVGAKIIKRWRGGRGETLAAWDAYTKNLRWSWSKTEQLRKAGQWDQIDLIWNRFRTWRTKHWTQYQQQHRITLSQQGNDIRRIFATTEPQAAAPTTQTPPTRPPEPPAEPPVAAAPVEPQPGPSAPSGAAPVPTPEVSAAPVQPAPAQAAPTLPPAAAAPPAPSNQELLKAAYAAGLPTMDEAGNAFDRALLNFAERYAPPRVARLDDLTPAQRARLLAELQGRGERKAAERAGKEAAKQNAARIKAEKAALKEAEKATKKAEQELKRAAKAAAKPAPKAAPKARPQPSTFTPTLPTTPLLGLPPPARTDPFTMRFPSEPYPSISMGPGGAPMQLGLPPPPRTEGFYGRFPSPGGAPLEMGPGARPPIDKPATIEPSQQIPGAPNEAPATPEQIIERTAAEAARPEKAAPQPAAVPDEYVAKSPDTPTEGGIGQPGQPDTTAVAGRPTPDVQSPGAAEAAPDGLRRTGTGGRSDGDVTPETGATVQRDDGDRLERGGLAERGERGGRGGERGRSGVPEPVTPGEPRIKRKQTPRGPDFVFTADFAENIDNGGYKTKIKQNIAAIELLKKLDTEGRKATVAEQEVLARFSGWGGAWQVFDNKYIGRDNWNYYSGKVTFSGGELSAEATQLAELMGRTEWESARRSTLNAHYTDTETIRFAWNAVRKMGFAGGRTLEPAMGIGRFYGLMPTDLAANSVRAGVELDTLSGRIAQELFQGVDVRVGGYETMTFRPGFFDLTISNVPFGNYGVFDQSIKDKAIKASIHNYYFAKALEHTRPGGMVAFITSAFTLDALDPHVRKYLAERAQLVAAVRLPAGQFRKSAHTDVVTDIIFLRKLNPGEAPPVNPSWLNAVEVKDPITGKPFKVNAYYTEHPENVLGRLGLEEGGQYQGEHMTVKADGRDMRLAFQHTVDRLPENVIKPSIDNAPTVRDTVEMAIAPTGVLEGQHIIKNGEVFHNEKGALTKLKADKTTGRIRGMIELTDLGRDILRRMVGDATDIDIVNGQRVLNQAYDQFVKQHGPIHATANLRALKGDPILPFLLGLEDWDSATQTATRAAIFTKRVISQAAPISAETPAAAMSASLLRRGRIDPDYIAQITGKSADETLTALEGQGLVFYTPEGSYVQRETYLSGNVRTKLAEAREAARTDPRFEDHVKALEAVKPVDLEAQDITLRMGLPLVPPDVLTDFVKRPDGMGLGNGSFLYSSLSGEWQMQFDYVDYRQNESIFGTNRQSAKDLLDDILNNRTTAVYDSHPDGTRTFNAVATQAAREKRQAIEQKWEDWWRKSRWQGDLTRLYNERFNAYVRPEYNGVHLLQPGAIPGMADIVSGKALALREYQANAIWRIVTSNNVLLAHSVGAGKTYTMIAAGMYMRQAGVVQRPMYVVPNHLVNQWAGDFGRLFPGARVLVADPKTYAGAAGREMLMGRATAGDWDAIIMPFSTFGLVSVSAENEIKFLREEVDLLRQFLDETQVGDSGMYYRSRKSASDKVRDRTVKEAEKKLAKLENRIKELQNTKAGTRTRSLNFEDMGVDYLFVDESHNFKNLQYQTNRGRDMKGLGPQNGSKRAFDLSMKIRMVQGANGGRGATLASGTPVSNSLVEMYTIMRYLQRDDLRRMGIERFDRWADAFGKVTGDMERTQIGDFKIVNRLRAFNNYDELMSLFYQVADIRNAKQINLPRPAIKGGAQRAIVLDMDEAQKAIIAELPERAEAIKSRRVPPSADNWLKLGTDSRKASIDSRFFDPNAPENPNGKVASVAREVARIYKETTSFKGAQVIFLDWGIPGGDTFNAYDALVAKLVASGIPANEIKYMQHPDFKKGEKRQLLFDDVNAGRVRVLISSREKLATGSNIQTRLTALHQVDTPMRWSDIEQSEGRILRPGNLHIGYDGNPIFGKDGRPVEIIRYLSRDSYDEWSWQKLETTSRYQVAVMNGDVRGREVTISDDISWDPAEMRAAMSGDPRVKEKINTDMKLTQLELSRAAHTQEQRRFQSDLTFMPKRIDFESNRLDTLRQTLPDAKRALDAMQIEIGPQRIDLKESGAYKKAGEALAAGDSATFGNFYIARAGDKAPSLEVRHPSGWQSGFILGESENPEQYALRNIINGLRNLEGDASRVETKLQGLISEEHQLQESIGQPWAKQVEYDDLLARRRQLEKELIGDTKQTDLDPIEDDATIKAAQRREVAEEDIEDALDTADDALPQARTRPSSQALGITYQPFDPLQAMQGGLDRYRSIMRDWRTPTGARLTQPLNTAQAAALKQWADKTVIPAMLRDKAMTGTLATDARNFALGDYTRRRNYNDLLQWLFPYHYWYNFTYNNWAQRFLQRPSLLSNYARYQEQLNRANTEYYRQVTGDPTATPPNYWARQLYLPWHGSQLSFNAEKLLNPLNALVEDFNSKTRNAAPGGEFLTQLGNFGPTVWSPIIWGYALWLANNGYPDAAAEWVNRLTPLSRPFQTATAAYKEAGLPGAGMIPAGGINVEKELLGRLAPVTGLDFTDPYEAKRIGYFLWRLRDEGKIGETEFQDTAYQQSGPAWDKAKQMAALNRAFPNLMSWLIGPAAKMYGKYDMQIDAMWNAWGNIWDAREQMPYDQWRRLFDTFDTQYPWGRSVMMARTLDPDERMKDYTYMLLDRLPPGAVRYDALQGAGLSDELMDKFYKTKGDFAQWTPAEVAAFRSGIDKLAAAHQVPTPEQAEDFEQAREQHDFRAGMALAQLSVKGYPLSRDDIRKLEGDYFALDAAQRQAYLTQHPELKLYWDLLRQQERQPVPGEGIAGAPQARTQGMTPQQAMGLEDTYWPPSASERIFRNLPPGYNWQNGLTLPQIVKDALDPAKRDSLTPEQLKEVEAWLLANVPKAFTNPEEWAVARELEAQFTAEIKQRFGPDIEKWASEYAALKGNDAARSAYRNADAKRYAALKAYWDFKDEFGKLNPVWGKYYGFTTSSSASTGRRSYSRRSYSSRSYSKRYYPKKTYYRKSYSKKYYSKKYYPKKYYSSRRYYGSNKYGITYPAANVAPPVPPTPPVWQTMKIVEFNTALDAMRKISPQVDQAITKLFGANVLSLALNFLALSDAARKAWLADPKNAHLLALLMRFFAWFGEMRNQTTDFASRILGSVPKATPTPVPVAPEIPAVPPAVETPVVG